MTIPKDKEGEQDDLAVVAAKSAAVPGITEADVMDISDSIRLELAVDRLAAEVAEKLEICESPLIREKQPLSKKDIIKQVLTLALAKEKELDLDKLRVVRNVSSKDGEVLVLDIQLPTDDGETHFICYTINGKYGSEFSMTTSIEETFWDEDGKDGIPSGGSNLAEYVDGKWKLC